MYWLSCILGLVAVAATAACNRVASPKSTPAPVAATPEHLPSLGTPTAGPGPASAGPQPGADTWVFRIVPGQSEARYEVQEELTFLGIDRSVAVGRTRAIEGEAQLALQNDTITLGANKFRVDLRTLTSDDQRRDARLREQWLESNRFPFAEFVATAAQGSMRNSSRGQELSYRLAGQMTVRHVTSPATYEIEAVLLGDTLAGTARATLRMSDFGFEPPASFGFFKVENEFTVVVEFSAKKTAVSP